MKLKATRVLPFTRNPAAGEEARVGRVHRDGSITFRGVKYATIREVPADCQALLPDLETFKEWKRLYSAIDPRAGRGRWKPSWLQ